MTSPVQLTSPSLGNFGLDLSQAGAGIAQGLQAEKARRREEAMSQALLDLNRMRANAALLQAQRGAKPFPITLQTEQGLRQALLDPDTNIARISQVEDEGQLGPAVRPEPRAIVQTQQGGQVGFGETPRYTPGSPVTPLGGPGPRLEAPKPLTVESPTGPVSGGLDPRTNVFRPATVGGQAGPSGQPAQPGPTGLVPGAPVQPRALQGEIEAGRGATQMSLANETLKRIEGSNLEVVNEVASNQAIRRATIRLPIVGEGLAGTVTVLTNQGLSPEAAEYLAALSAFMVNRVRAIAGATMTVNEMLIAMSEFVPDVNEISKPAAFAQKVLNRERIIETMIRSAGAGMQRFESMLPGEPQPPAPRRHDRFLRP